MDQNDISSYRNRRVSVLSTAAYVTVLVCLAVTVWVSDMSEYAQGVLTVVLGKYLSYTDQVYAYDFGTTRSSNAKDATIATLSNSAVDQNLTKEQK